jgi:ornithine carbamoyltransferase
MSVKHFLVDTDLSPAEQGAVLDLAAELKANRAADRVKTVRPLSGQSIAVLFEKHSTRTRMSFEVGIAELGGHPMVIDTQNTQMSRGEPLHDTAAILSGYVDAVVMRTYGQDRLEELAANCDVPVVNALTDFSHPCQALADILTLRELKGDLKGRTLAYVGDGNNVAHSLLLAGATAGLRVHVATPPGFEPLEQVVRHANEIGAVTGGEALVMHEAREAVAGADAVYTDVWASMGQEDEEDSRALVFKPFQLDSVVLAEALPDAVVMHCLPAHRGQEISAEVIDGPQSVVWQQAENRLHAQKALLMHLLGARRENS